MSDTHSQPAGTQAAGAEAGPPAAGGAARPAAPASAEDVLGVAGTWAQAGEAVAIATVTETWGSSPRPAGSQMVVTRSGRMAGSVSGGCIEGAVADAAMRTLADGVPQLLDFGVTNERAWEVGLACGGKLKVFVERLA